MKFESAFPVNYKSPYVFVVFLVVFASIIRLYQLGVIPLSLYYDEITSVYFPFLYFQGEKSLPVVSILISIVTGTISIYGFAGPSAFWTRVPSVVYGVLFVVVCWALGRRLYGQRVGILAGLLASVIPWSLHFSRYGVVCVVSYAFYVALAVYLLVLYFQTGKDRFKFAAFIVVGVSLYTHAMALIFDTLFFPLIIFAGLVYNRTKLRKILGNMLLFFMIFLVFASPFLISYLFMAEQFSFQTHTTIQHYSGIIEVVEGVVKRAYLHLSPDFLVISTGKSFSMLNGSGEFITQSGLYYFGTAGKTGILNTYGIFVYLGFLWLIYKVVKRPIVSFRWILLIWWVASYAIASGFAYYDNPNAARNIVGLPAFILVISLVISKVWHVLFNSNDGYISKRAFKRSFPVKMLKSLFLISLIVPSVYYLPTYVMTYESSYDYFDYDYKLLSDYLTENQLWNNSIVLNETRPDKWYANIVLSFYNHSASKRIVVGNLSTALSMLKYRKNTVVYVTRNISNQSSSSPLFRFTFLNIIYYPDNTPVFAVWKINRL
ncbi:MAG: glycosyltransferase family 39 protein [Candidatus Bathyarchaeia archaeon]